MFNSALQTVIEDAENRLVVGLPRSLIRQSMRQNHHLIQIDKESRVTRFRAERSHQLERIVKVLVRDDPTDTKRLARLGLCRELRSQPAQRSGLQAIVTCDVTFVIACQDL